MKAIVTVDNNWGIGKAGQSLVGIPACLRLVNEKTVGKVVVMCRNSLAELPGGRPLKARTSFVLTSDMSYSDVTAIVVNDIDELVKKLEDYNTDDVYVIGGDYIYKSLLKMCDEVYVTKIDYTYNADAYFENLDESDEWVLESESDEETYYDLEYYNLKYVRK